MPVSFLNKFVIFSWCLFLFFPQRIDSLKGQKIKINFNLEILFYTVSIGKLQELISLKMFWHFFHRNHFFSVFFRRVLIFSLKILYCIYIVVLISEAYSETYQTSKLEFFLLKYLTAWSCYFCKKLHLRCLTGFCTLLWIL